MCCSIVPNDDFKVYLSSPLSYTGPLSHCSADTDNPASDCRAAEHVCV